MATTRTLRCSLCTGTFEQSGPGRARLACDECQPRKRRSRAPAPGGWCVECSGQVVRPPGQTGPLPKRCDACRLKSIPARQLLRCASCDAAFISRPTQRFCSMECRQAHKRWLRRRPCGDCGRAIYITDGTATCRSCRAAGRALESAYRRRRAQVPCPVCANLFRPVKSGAPGGLSRTCSRSCGQRYSAGLRDRVAAKASRRAKERLRCATRRSRKQLNFVEYVDPDKVFDRDGWICHLCHRRVDKSLSGRHRMGATLDHLVPLADGGEHSYANVALAHRSCNSRKGAKPANVQLALMG